MMWALLVQWAGVYAISTYRERAALLRAGLVVGGAGAIAALAVEVLRRTVEPWSHALVRRGSGVRRRARSASGSSCRSRCRCSSGCSTC